MKYPNPVHKSIQTRTARQPYLGRKTWYATVLSLDIYEAHPPHGVARPVAESLKLRRYSQHHITEEWPTEPHIACNKYLRILKHTITIKIRTHRLKQTAFAFAEASCG